MDAAATADGVNAQAWTELVVGSLGFGGIIFRAGQLTNALKDLVRRVERIERHIWPD